MTDLELAHLLADTADAITRPYVGGNPPVRRKPDGSPVTPVDEAVEAALLDVVARERPADGFLGEEVGEAGPRAARSARGPGGRRWIVDGIDGTAAFVRSRPEWATLIGLEEAGQFAVGVVSAPAIGARWWGAAGQGAWERRGDGPPEPLRPSGVADLPRARVGIWPPTEDLRGAHAEAARRLRARTLDPWTIRHDRATSGDRPTAGSGYSNAALLVAAGILDAVVLFGGSPWDHAALVAILEAAGGRFTDLHGGHRIDADSGIYANGHLGDAIRATMDL